jgi:type II secretory pathway component PulJ
MNVPGKLSDERGTTLIELMVGLMAGMVIVTALTTVIIVTLHGSARVSARVEATQRARLTLTRVVEDLHSACVAPQMTPIQETSTGTSLSFLHAEPSEASAVSPTPVKSVIGYENGVLTKSDYTATGGTAPDWVYEGEPSTRQLLTDVQPLSPGAPIFRYYKYSNGALVEIPATTAIGAEADLAIQVKVAFNAAPERTRVADAGADASIQGSATLRLTPPSFNQGALSLPCQ